MPTTIINLRVLSVIALYCAAAQGARADDITFLNGDRVTGKLITFSKATCEFQTGQARLLIPSDNVRNLNTSVPTTVLLTSQERLTGRATSCAGGTITVHSDALGAVCVRLSDVLSVSRNERPEESGDSSSGKTAATAPNLSNAELASTHAKGTRPQKPVSGEKTSNPEEHSSGEDAGDEMHKYFLRESTVLLRPRQVEAEVGIQYSHDNASVPGVFSVRSRRFTMPLGLRIGMFKDAEVSLGVPLVSEHEETVDILSGKSERRHKAGIGDLAASVRYVALKERRNWPDVILSLSGTAPTGGAFSRGGLNLGLGTWSVSGGVQVVKSFDPIVIFGGMSYTYQLGRSLGSSTENAGSETSTRSQASEREAERSNIGYNLGMGFSVNENISLSAQVVGGYQTSSVINGATIGGSSVETLATRLGLTFRVAKDQFVEASVLWGLSEDAPDGVVGLNYSKRF